MTINVIFLDSGREPRCKPDPAYPNGKAVNLAHAVEAKVCTKNLPYPAPRCGVYQITCRKCGFKAAITVAGQPDDPNMVTMPCKIGGLNG
jgi:hypothetical protein